MEKECKSGRVSALAQDYQYSKVAAMWNSRGKKSSSSTGSEQASTILKHHAQKSLNDVCFGGEEREQIVCLRQDKYDNSKRAFSYILGSFWCNFYHPTAGFSLLKQKDFQKQQLLT